MIDQEKVKRFWDNRARRLAILPPESLANLEENPELLAEKIQLEQERVFSFLPDLTGKTILDLGAGVGQWTFRFCEKGASFITAVEYSQPMSDIAVGIAKKEGWNNVEFVVSPAELFRAERKYDIIFISGLFVYLNDDQAEKLVFSLGNMCSEGCIILVRDGTGTKSRHEISGKMSEGVGDIYSAVYRTREEYIDMFSTGGMKLAGDSDMFPPGSRLNKYPETRLRVYVFKPECLSEGVR